MKKLLLSLYPLAQPFQRNTDFDPEDPEAFNPSGQSLRTRGCFYATSGFVTCGINRTSAVKSAT